MSDNERDFKGVWIPKAVWLDTRLNALEKIILTEIDSLDSGERGCWASNKHIAEFCQCSETKVSKAISKLVKLEYLYIQYFDGRQRELKSSLQKMQGRLAKNARQTRKIDKADSQKMQESNTKNNTNNNSVKEERKKATSYDAILSTVENEDLRELYLEYIKMRKLIKSPMTDRALTMLIKKVKDLEPLSIERQKRLLETAIMNNWKSVYPLKDEPKNQGASFDVDEFFNAALKRGYQGNVSPRSALERSAAERMAEEKQQSNDPELQKRAEELKNKLKG